MSLAEAWSSFGSNAFAGDPTASVQELAASIFLSSSQGSSQGPSPASLTLSKDASPSRSSLDCVAAKANRGRGTPAACATAPSSNESTKEDDWTRVKDPKEKKRIQNRIAQRTYRHRMKARLGELQAKLDGHEQRRFQPVLPEAGGQRARGRRAPPDNKAEKAALPTPMMHDSVFQQPLVTDPPLYGQDVPHVDGSSEPRVRPGAGRSITVSQDFILDCLRFQTQLLNRLNRLQSPEDASAYDASDDVVTSDPSPPQHVDCVQGLSPSRSDGLEFAFDDPTEGWKDESLSQPLRQPSPPADGLQYHHSLSMPTPLGSDASHAATLDERLGGFMQHIEAAGFESFDDLVTAYYSDSFVETSPLANEQHLSRNRRLPKVICRLYKATSEWSTWERRGFHDEILKTAEAMLVSETSGVRGLLMSRIRPLIEAQDGIVSPHAGEVLHDVKRSIQQELPKSWAFAMALAAQNRSRWQQDRSGTALATILLLQFGGQIPHNQLLQLIGMCL